MSTPLERGSTVIHCAVCIQAGRATEATYQTAAGLCGCDQHINQLEKHGLAALRRQRNTAATSVVTSGESGPDVYADLFDDDLDVVADRLDSAIKSTADSVRTESGK